MLKKYLKNLKRGEYQDLYVQSDTLLLADVLENFRNKCTEIYELDPTHFLSAPGLARQACLKETGIKLELLTNNNMLMMVEKGIRYGICHAIHRYEKANSKYMKNYDKNIGSSYIIYLDTNNLNGWARFQKLPVNGFKWKKNVSKSDKEFIKRYDGDSNKGYIIEVDVEYPKDLHNLHSDLPFLSERMKIKKCNKFDKKRKKEYDVKEYDKKECVVHIRALKQALNHGLIFKKYID